MEVDGTVISSALGSACTALHSAVRGGRPDVLRLLLVRGNDGAGANALAVGVVAKESLYGTPLDFARQRGERECAAILEKHCSNEKAF